MNRQVANKLNGQVQYPARRRGFLQWTIAGIIGIVCLSAVACQPLEVPAEGSGSETTLAAAAPAQEENQEDTEMIELELSAPEQMLVELAETDLSTELGVDLEQINVANVTPVDFSDASLGCPEEGMMYAQVITSGYELMLEVDGTAYEYHGTAQGDGRVVRCGK